MSHIVCILYTQMAGVPSCMWKRGQRMYTHVSRKMYTFVYVTPNMHFVYANGGCSIVHVEKRTTNIYACESKNVRIFICHTQYVYSNGGCSVVHTAKKTIVNESLLLHVNMCTCKYMSQKKYVCDMPKLCVTQHLMHAYAQCSLYLFDVL